MIRKAILAGILTAALLWPNLAEGVTRPTQSVRIVNSPLSARATATVKRDLTTWMNRQVQPRWQTPTIRFASYGWRIIVKTPAQVAADNGIPSSGFHDVDATGHPFAEVAWDGNRQNFEQDLSHELLEMMVDPYNVRVINGYAAEPADPVENNIYLVGSTHVSDFVFSRWYYAGTRGPWDQMRSTERAQDDSFGAITLPLDTPAVG